MDSMRNLHTSLPHTSQPPEALLSAFRAAALSVTNLYKTATSSQTDARSAGYQDALDDLLSFLDQQDLGLGDGEGWRVRQWATERLEGSLPQREAVASSDDDGETVEVQNHATSPSPEIQRRKSLEEQRLGPRSMSPPRERKAPIQTPTEQQPEPASLPEPAENNQPHLQKADVFTFRSSTSYPSNHERDMELDSGSTERTLPQQPLRVEVVPRHSRSSRHYGQNHRGANRSATSLVSLGSAPGTKRKAPLGDFFDISGLSFEGGRDSSGRGGKRGRHA
ncbi:hypothetical protein LTR66_005355 [Elasticomyces elasticus]|nr:hypothetical protein LTR66_005355 [Elasticomyces elasticus]